MEIRKNQLHLAGFTPKKIDFKSLEGKKILKGAAIKGAMNKLVGQVSKKRESWGVVKKIKNQLPIEQIFQNLSRHFKS